MAMTTGMTVAQQINKHGPCWDCGAGARAWMARNDVGLGLWGTVGGGGGGEMGSDRKNSLLHIPFILNFL